MEEEAEKQVWQNKTKVEEVKGRVARLEKDFKEYKKEKRKKDLQNYLNTKTVLATIIGVIITLVGQYVIQNVV